MTSKKYSNFVRVPKIRKRMLVKEDEEIQLCSILTLSETQTFKMSFVNLMCQITISMRFMISSFTKLANDSQNIFIYKSLFNTVLGNLSN